QAQQGAVKQPSSNSAQQDRQDGKTEIAQNGMVIVHGSGNPGMSEQDIQIVRASGQKQGKKGRVYGGFYGTSEQDAHQAQQGAVKQPSSNSAQQDRQDGKTEIAQNGMVIVHGSGNPGMSEQDIQIVRASGQKQGKKGRVYGGFYGTSEQDAHQAQAYADMMGGTPTLYDVKIKPGTKVLHKQGDITRLSESYINELVSQGYGVVTGTDPRGQTEHVVIDKSAVASMAPRGAQATPSQVNDINVADMRQPSDQPAKNVSADTVPAPSATAGEASQLVPAIDTGYREVIPGNQPQVEVSNEPVTPIPAISSERSGDQPGAGEPAAAGAGPAVAGLTDRAGSGDRADLAAPAPVPDGQQQNDPTLTAPATDAGAAVSGRIGEEELRDRDLLKEHGGHWKYRSAVGAGWFTANTKEAAIERAEEAYRKAVSKGEPVPTRDERFAQADAELFSEMDRRYGKMSTPELEAEYQRLGGEVGDLQKSGSGEFNGNGGRRTGAAVSNEGARQVGEERLRLGVYMKMRRDRDTAGSGAKSQQIEPANDWRGAKSATDYHAAKRRLFSGEMEFSEFQAMSRSALDNAPSLRAELEKKTKQDLLDQMSPFNAARYKNDKKAVVVEAAYNQLIGDLRWAANGDGNTISETYAIGGARQSIEERVAKALDGLTPERYQQFVNKQRADVAKRDAELAATKEALRDPQTLEQFKTFLKYRSLDKLTPEQRARYEDLIAASNLDKRDQAREVKAATAVTPTASGDIIKTKHTKSGEDLFVVQMGDRVDRDTYNQINAHAKKLGGWYSSYKVGGAVPGFQFKDEAKATEFRGWLTGQGAASAAPSAEAAPTEVTDPDQDNSKSKQVETLRTRAKTLRDKAAAALNAERKENTNKRMTEAANARANAESELHFAGLLDAIADGIESGEVTYLRNLANGTQLTELNHALSRSLWNLPPARREALTSQGMIERTEDGRERWSAKATPEMMAEGAQMPGMDYFARNLKDVATKMQGASGFKQAGAKIMALVNAAINRDSKTVSITDPELIAKLKAYTSGVSDYDAKAVKEQIGGYSRLERMGITNHTELRAALRELARLQAGLKKQAVPRDPLAEKMVALKRKLVGNRNAFIDFFPTPESHAADLVALAGIEPGMTVLEPSAGHGMLAEAARAAGAKVDAVELAVDLREILQAKGFGLVGGDFMDTTPAQSYDAVVMNPPFSNDMDIDHVRHAYDHLKPGGRLVAIVSATAGDRQNNKNKAFREWFDGLGGSEQAMPDGAFKASLNPTDVRTKIFVIDKPANEVKPLPSPEGKRVTVATPKGQSVEVQYRVMEAADLVASHDFEGNINHDYPQQLQPRDRSKQTYLVQVGQIAAAPEGARLAASPETDRGAPIVRDGIVESGNGRTIGLKKAYQRGDAGAYRAYLLANATEFGLDAAAIEAMSAPVLVRERLTEMDDQQLRDFVVDSNTDAKMANSATEDARADAGKLTTQMLNMLNIPDGGDVLAAQNHHFLQAFLRAIGENQSNSYVNQSGGWNAEYGKRVKAAIFAYGYDNQRLLDAVTGETDEVGRNMIAALLNNAVAMAQLRQHSPERAKSLANYLAEAVESVVHNKRSGQSLQELAAQGDMLGGGPSTESSLLAQAMASNARSAKAMTEMIGDILAMMNKTPSNDMFGEAVTPITAEEAIRETLRAIDAYNQQRNQTPRPSGDLFGLAAARNDHGTTPSVSGHRDGGATESAADQGLNAPKWAKEPKERHTVAGISFKVPVFDKELQKTFNEAVHRGEGRNFAQEIQTVANRLALDLEADGLLATHNQRVLASQLIESWVEREIDNAKKTMAYGIANPSWMVTGTSGNQFSKRRQKSNLELENERQADHEKAQEAAVKRMRAALKELQSPEAKRAEAFKLAWRDARTILRDLSSYLSQGKTALLAELRKSGAPKLAKLFDTMAESDPARHRSELQSQDQRFKEAGMPGLIALIGERTKAGKMLAELLGEEGQSPSQTPNSLRMSQQRIAAVARREGLSAHDVAEIVFDFRAEYKGARSLDFIVGQTQEDLYGPEGSPEQIGWNDGGYLPSKQQVHLIADSINRRARGKDLHEGGREERGVSGDPVLDNSVRPTLRSGPDAGGARAKAEVVSTLRHEVLGHYGLDTFTPDDKQHLLQKLIDAKNEKWIAPVWQQISGDSVYSKNSDLHQAEEVFAHIAEKALPSRTIQAWRDIKTELSRLLRKIGLVKGPIKEHELDSLIKAISKGIRNGERTRQNIRGDKQVIGKPTKAMTASEVEMVLTGWLKRYQGAGNIKVAVHATQAEMEQALGIDPQPGLVRRAAFDDDTTTLHIAANTISDPKRLNEILRHEVLAHYGLARTLGGKEFTKLLSRVINSRNNPSMKAVWDWVEANYDNEEIGVQAEEVIAHLAELEPSAWQRGWDRVVAWVMGALRSVGFAPGKVSASEIRSMIAALGRNMEGGPNGGPNGGKGKRNIRFSQSQGAGLAQGMAGRAKYQAGGVLDAVRNFLKQRRPLMLGTLTDLQIDQLYRDITGGAVSAYQRLRTKMEAERNDILLDAETRIDPLWDALEKQEKADLSSLMHDATMSRLHPDKPLDENSYYLEAK
ncbi:methyltransferase, partial [Aeromonas sp. QDB06]